MNTDAAASAIEKAAGLLGDQAARVWPQMVEAWVFSGFLGLGVLSVFLILSIHWCRWTLDRPDDDDSCIGLLRIASGLVLGFVIVIFFAHGADLLCRIRYPEATLIYNIMKPSK